MHHHWIMKYLHLYAEAFDLYKFIRFHTKVVDLKMASDFVESGKWEIFFRDNNSEKPEEVRKQVFDAVMLCVGHHSEPSWPSFPGMDKFSGVKMHSHAYKDFKPFENKNVLVVGMYEIESSFIPPLSLALKPFQVSALSCFFLI